MTVSHVPFLREILFSNETINVKFQCTCSIAASSGIEGQQAWKSLENCKNGFNLIWTPDRSVIWQITAFHSEVLKYSITKTIMRYWVTSVIYLVGKWLFIKGRNTARLDQSQGQKYSLTMSFMYYTKPSLSRRSIYCTGSNITLDGDSGYLNSLSETIWSRKAPSERPIASQWRYANTNKTLLPDKWWFLMLGWCNWSEFNRGHTLLFTDSKCCRDSISYLLLCHNTHLFRKMCNKRSGWQFQPRL